MSENEAQTSTPKPIAKRGPAVSIPGVRLGAQLGFGGMATVFEGWDDGFNPPRRVAIKLMNTELSADPSFRVRFEREASLVADFRHDNIVHVYASGESAGIKYIVMEYLGGGTLAQRLGKGALPPGEALSHAAALCDALAYSHRQGIVHRDVKPANVLFTSDGKPVLSDFGVAKYSTAASGSLTHQTSVVGAPRYMAPEQELGDQVSDRADVYSLGLTLYEMLTGAPPSTAVRLQRIVDEHNHFGELLPSLPSRVTELLDRCLQLDPAARPSAAEFTRHLQAAAADFIVSADSAQARPAKLRLALAGIVGGSLVMSAALATLWMRSQDESVRGSTPNPTVTLTLERTPTAAQVYVDGRLATAATLELAHGHHRVIAVARGHYGQVQTIQVGDPPVPLKIELQPTKLPSAAEFERFLDLADAPSISATDRDSMSETTLRTALSTRLLREHASPAALHALEQDLQDLADAGDARATVALLLAPAIRAGRITANANDARLMAAAAGGDAMASFFAALSVRSRVQEATAKGASVGSELQMYCTLMRQAVDQGWQVVAGEHLRRDGCR